MQVDRVWRLSDPVQVTISFCGHGPVHAQPNCLCKSVSVHANLAPDQTLSNKFGFLQGRYHGSDMSWIRATTKNTEGRSRTSVNVWYYIQMHQDGHDKPAPTVGV